MLNELSNVKSESNFNLDYWIKLYPYEKLDEPMKDSSKSSTTKEMEGNPAILLVSAKDSNIYIENRPKIDRNHHHYTYRFDT